ncbi:MAG TPA: prolyl oligopeptidase family serine peptidase [Rhabdochlamydiaceae bacterium]|nr:prolyl oligopeptidase family serine peptidase [Rhabdochlamydiaceae bacterium]
MSFFIDDEQVLAETSKENLFRTSPFISAKVSPDGKTIAYVGADPNGISNVFIMPCNQLSECTQITFFTTPEIIQFFWSANSDKVLLLKDEDGTGLLHLHGVDIFSKKHVVYTETFSKVSTKVVQISAQKNRAVIGLNHRNPHFHDLYTVDLDSGKLTLLFENDAYAKFLVSDSLELILKMKINEDGSWTVFTDRDDIFMQLSSEDAFQTEYISYDEKKDAVYLLDNRFSNTNQLIVKSLSGKDNETVLGAQPDSDVEEVLLIDNEPKAYASYYIQKTWHVIDPEFTHDLSVLENQAGRNFEVVNSSKHGNIWIVSNSIPDEGTRFWIYDRKSRSLSPLYPSSSGSHSFSKMYPMIVDARDGHKLVCYYTLPKEHDRGGYVDSPIPLVVVPHGGPFKIRERYAFNLWHQWLASCGYAVLSVNFRLSSGFGKAFVNAGNGEWGSKAHLDVIDAVECCISKGLTQRGKLGMFGSSYGGYETLASLTFSPEYFTCCISICGPSNLKTVLDNVPQFWEFTSKPLSDKLMFFTKKAFITSMGGDPNTKEGIEYLQKCSPLNFLDGIKAPLLLVHGKNDHVVAENESRQIYESMKKNGKKVTYILFPDEGHRLAKFPNKMLYLDRAEQFLSRHLGGKYTPVEKNAVIHSTAQIYE